MHSTAQNETGKSSGAKNEEPICRRIKEQEVVYVLHGGVPRSRLKHYDLDFVVNPHACLGLCLPDRDFFSDLGLPLGKSDRGKLPTS